MFLGGHFSAICLIALAAGLFAYASIKPTFRLRTEMPPQFADATASTQQSTEAKIARAYWDCAMIQVQWKYVYGQHLPEEPPRAFVIASEEFGEAARDPVTRARYWRRLQAVWFMPGAWHKTYEWDFSWLITWIDPTQRWLNNHLPGLNNNSAT